MVTYLTFIDNGWVRNSGISTRVKDRVLVYIKTKRKH